MFAPSQRQAIAAQLGRLLTSIHSFPLERARELDLDEQDPDDFGDYLETNPNALPTVERLVYPCISASERRWLETLFTRYIALIRQQPFETRVTHGDMWTHHVIVDPVAQTLAGVIDFWGRIADPANDFKAFEHYGNDFVQRSCGTTRSRLIRYSRLGVSSTPVTTKSSSWPGPWSGETRRRLARDRNHFTPT